MNNVIHPPQTPDERKTALISNVNSHVARGWRVESQTDFNAVLVKGRRPNHLLHFLIGFVTLSLWWFMVWIPLAVFGGEKRRTIAA